MAAEIAPLSDGQWSFLGAERVQSLDRLAADVAVVGIPFGIPYDMTQSTGWCSDAPAKIREQSQRFLTFLRNYDIDFDGDIFAGRDLRIADLGDVAMLPGQFQRNIETSRDVVRAILDSGALPVVFGGRHDITIPVLRAYEGREPMCIVQVDAHFDWADEINGIRDGLSSVMRRASEMPWVSGMAQIGLRGNGSATQKDVDDVRAYGSVVVTAHEVHRNGIDAAIARIPDAERYFITFDMDGMDPSIAPGIGSLLFGGLDYFHAFDLLRGVAAKGQVVGFDLTVVRPELDLHDMTSHLAARITLNMLGALAHEGQIGR